MSDAILAAQKSAMQAGLRLIYGASTITKAAAVVSNGRGGFTRTNADPVDILVKRETSRFELARMNIEPGKAMIFVLNEGIEPVEGDHITMADGTVFAVTGVKLDALSAVYECEADYA